MLNASLAFMTSALTPYLLAGEELPRMGNTGYSGLPGSALFTPRDGRQISLGIVLPETVRCAAEYLGREDWLADPRYATPEAQRADFEALHGELAVELGRKDAALPESEMSERAIPCGMDRRVGEAAELVGDTGLEPIALDTVPPGGRPVIPNAGFHIYPAGPASSAVPPKLDGDRAEILAWLASGGDG